MSLFSSGDIITEGDTVIIHVDFATMLAARIDPASPKANTIQTKYGAIPLKDIVGMRFGTKFHCKKGYVYILRPTPELWTKTLPFRTQILYLPDISMIIMQLDLKPGSVVGESGTGSGSLSHSIASVIAPSGHLYTFDYHDARVQQARQEFANHGLESIVTAQHADVYKDGYGNLENQLDAILLDLPCPWLAVPNAKKALKKGGSRLGSFSPCIEQVQRTCETLKNEGFVDVITLECLMKPLEVKVMAVNSWVPPKATVIDVSDRNRPKTPFAQTSVVTAVVPREVPGHSGYIIFASLY